MDAEADADSDSSQLHIVVFPWLAFGHLLPFLDLAERIADRGHRVSFVSTPRNISRLPQVSPAVATLVDFVSLPLPRVDGLPEGAEATTDLPPDKYELLQKASDGLAAPFSAFLDAARGYKKPDWVILDTFHYLAAAAALDQKVPSAMFMTFSAATSVLYGVPRVSRVVHDELGASLAQRCLFTYERCKIIAQRCCVELEPESVPLLPKIFGKPVSPVGLLPPPLSGSRSLRTNGAAAGQGDTLMSWLDRQLAKSVVYVALGSEAPLSTELVHEMALGLELAGTRFLWALRKPSVVPDADILPPGFEERTHGRGLVTMGLVPQTRILAHATVCAFFTHCGWSSTIEGMQYGHPLIMLPFFGDQGPNARLMEAKKAGVHVARNEKDGSFDREGVAAAVHAVAVEEDSRRVFAANAKKLQELVADTACHERCIDEFIQQLRSCKE